MKLQFEYNRITRERLSGAIEGLSIEELTKKPEGFNNNILWNFGHILVTQHLLCFKLAGMETQIPDDIIDAYRKGSAPDSTRNLEADLNYFKSNLTKLVDLTEEAYNEGKLANFHVYTTSYGVQLNSVEEAITFNNMHEALHLGYIMAQKKSL